MKFWIDRNREETTKEHSFTINGENGSFLLQVYLPIKGDESWTIVEEINCANDSRRGIGIDNCLLYESIWFKIPARIKNFSFKAEKLGRVDRD